MGLINNGLHFGYLSECLLSKLYGNYYIFDIQSSNQFVDKHMVVFNPSNFDLGGIPFESAKYAHGDFFSSMTTKLLYNYEACPTYTRSVSGHITFIKLFIIFFIIA